MGKSKICKKQNGAVDLATMGPLPALTLKQRVPLYVLSPCIPTYSSYFSPSRQTILPVLMSVSSDPCMYRASWIFAGNITFAIYMDNVYVNVHFTKHHWFCPAEHEFSRVVMKIFFYNFRKHQSSWGDFHYICQWNYGKNRNHFPNDQNWLCHRAGTTRSRIAEAQSGKQQSFIEFAR